MRTGALLLMLLLAGCGSGSDATVQEPASTELSVEYVATNNGAVQTLMLTCDPAGGDHPAPAAACRDLAQEQQPFAPLTPEDACAEIDGGPQTAVVSGTYRGQQVTLRVSRTDGCRIAQWDRLGALLSAVAPS